MKPLPHISHENGVSSPWSRTCRRRFPTKVNVWLHCGHECILGMFASMFGETPELDENKDRTSDLFECSSVGFANSPPLLAFTSSPSVLHRALLRRDVTTLELLIGTGWDRSDGRSGTSVVCVSVAGNAAIRLSWKGSEGSDGRENPKILLSQVSG